MGPRFEFFEGNLADWSMLLGLVAGFVMGYACCWAYSTWLGDDK